MLSSLGLVGIQEPLCVGDRGQVVRGASPRGRGLGEMACHLLVAGGLNVAHGEVRDCGHAVEQDLHYGRVPLAL